MKRTNKIASQVMKLAHSIKAQFATFSQALKAAWAQVKQPAKTITGLLIEIGGKQWTKEGFNRIYLTCNQLNAFCEKIGKDAFYSLNDTKNKIYFEDGAIYRRYNNGAPKKEFSI